MSSFPSKLSAGFALTYILSSVLLAGCVKTALFDFSDAEQALAFYGVYHREPLNQFIHFIGVPIIIWSGVVISSHCVLFPNAPTFSFPGIPQHALNLGTLWITMYIGFYFSIDVEGAFLYLPFLYLYYATAIHWIQRDQARAGVKDKAPHWNGTNNLICWSVVLNLLSWYAQIHLGHKIIEGANPAVLANVGGALTAAPLFAFYEGLWVLGVKKDLRQQVQTLVGQYTEELCEKGASMRVCETLRQEGFPKESISAVPGDKDPEQLLQEKLDALLQAKENVNTKGAQEKHMPRISFDTEGSASVVVPHVMTPDHWIEYLWLVDRETNTVLATQEFSNEEEKSPTISIQSLTPGSQVQAVAYCNLHGLWMSDPTTIPVGTS